ncbi:YncE family protein [Aquamicrobium zhengzhouense]|nr:glutaminyl-peptide cyclotransferase [Aquamicrobium zhengzhouense]
MTNFASHRRLNGFRLAARAAILAGSLAVGMSAALAQVAFDAPDAAYAGQVRAQAAKPGAPVLAGSEVKIVGDKFKPGQEITLSRGLTPLADGIKADDEGKFETSFTLPTDAAVGTHPLVLAAQAPYNAAIVELKVSPDIAISGTDLFNTQDAKLVPGLYQTAYSAKNDVLFVTAAVGRPPVKQSALLKVNPETLEIIAQITPGEAPGRGDREGGVYALYGVAVDDENGNVWVSNTRQNTVAVYKQDDLSLVKQFEEGAATHSRDLVVAGGKVYVSPVGHPAVMVFDAKSVEVAGEIEIKSGKRGQEFSPLSLEYDARSGKLFVISLSTAEVAIIDTAKGEVEKVIPVAGAKGAIGIAYDGETNRIFVAAQGSDNLSIIDAASGETIKNVLVGAGALNVAFEPVKRLAYVANRGAGTVTVLDVDGNIVANLENAPQPNHLHEDGKGNVFVVNKGRGEDEASDRIVRLSVKD